MATGGGWGQRPGQRMAIRFGYDWNLSLPSRTFHLGRTKGGKLRSANIITIESLPWEVLQQIFSYLDISSLLCAGCVSKSFYQVANDNLIWRRIYCRYFACKSNAWKPRGVAIATEKLSRITIQDCPTGFWKKEYISKCAGLGTKRVGQLLKSINRYTGLPSKYKETVKALGITWIIVLRERNGIEHVKEQSKAYFNDTSATLCWNSTVWPSLTSLKALYVYGVTPLFHLSKTPAINGPRRRSLLAEYDLTNLEKLSTYVGGDKLIKLQCLYPGMLLGCWQEDGELAVIIASFHCHQLIEKSTFGSVTCQYSPPPHEPVLDDIDPEYGLHGYHCHIALHNGKSCFMSGSFHNIICRKEFIQNGFLQITVISSNKESQHSTISGNLYLPWNTESLKGSIQHCCLMDVTVLDEAEKPFWSVSSPVALHSVSTSTIRYSYLGERQAIDYEDPEGKVHIELMWLEEEQQYYIVNLVLYFIVKKINAWFATNY
ncbi:F-box only protein 15 isoform X2 [Chiloscyllium plagiosum]|uniref:F-box only protein 15 isoform X2 n=1 Tax=Chiloscyllium plagiosum TaxID=36176 RepID=UPI001CB85EEF|nr:F-box only protein 15 isoform X2 [Chiloscyllium plagiosum]